MDNQAAMSGQNPEQRNPRFVSNNRSRSNPSAEGENFSRGHRSGGKANVNKELRMPNGVA